MLLPFVPQFATCELSDKKTVDVVINCIHTILRNLLSRFPSYILTRYHLSMWELSSNSFSEESGKALECSSLTLSLVQPPQLSSHTYLICPFLACFSVPRKTLFFFFLVGFVHKCDSIRGVIYLSWKSDCWKCWGCKGDGFVWLLIGMSGLGLQALQWQFPLCLSGIDALCKQMLRSPATQLFTSQTLANLKHFGVGKLQQAYENYGILSVLIKSSY